MSKIKLIITLLLFPFISFSQLTEGEVREMAQSATEQELVVQSSTMIQEKYYFHAEILVDRLLVMKPESANYNYRKGFLILGSRSDYIEALPYLKKAVQFTDKNYDAYSAREESSPTDAFYHLGRCYHLNEELDMAREFYHKFIEFSGKHSPVIEFAKLNIKQCDVAENLIKNPKPAIVKNIGNNVNRSTPEYAPVISLDGTSLYFTSRRGWEDKSTDEFRDPMLNNFPEDIFVSYQDFEGEWSSPEKLAFCDNRLNEATIAVSSDERKIYVYLDASGGGDIYFSNFENNQFEDLEKLRYNGVNTKYWETHCTVTPDGQNMYFVSDRPDGIGGRDIYRIVKLPNGKWSEPLNMGPGINTKYDEDSPFIAPNNKTLYFSSNGPQSMGGFDVFVTFRDENNVWSTPINLGYPINSTGDDIFYTTTVDGLRGYLSSFRKGGYGEKDIYEIQNDYLGNRPISTLKGHIYTVENVPLPEDLMVKLECTTCEYNDDNITYPRIKNGSYFSVLNRCKDYTVSFYQGDNHLKTLNFSTKCNAENEEIVKNYVLGGYTLAGTVSDDKSLELLENSKVEFLKISDDTVFESFDTDKNGAFASDYLDNFEFGEKVAFNVRVSKENYLTRTFKVDITLGTSPHIQLDYLINKTEIGTDIGKVFDINPIYFDLDKSNIRPDAALELDKIVRIMNENPSITIELGSHTDCRASIAYNISLSNRRAKSSAKYIQARIANAKRIYGKGYGESQLVNDCECEGDVVSDCTDEEHQANRRTEFRIVKK
jgi:outer membrane protein OmpA-like peptidoglycan-associated protein/tetratricopeptide (TPR) repeat protein